VTRSLPDDGPERKIFLRALRTYSENCRPPALTPGCPFAYKIEPGIRGCGEECMDLLARYDAPPPVDEIRVGSDIALRRRVPRPRRGPTPATKPFDAQEIYLTDRTAANKSDWRLPALLFGLKRELMWDEGDSAVDRLSSIGEYLTEVHRRGLDSDKLIRYGYSRYLPNAIYMAVTMAAIMDVGPLSSANPDGARWNSVINIPPTPETDDLATRLSASFDPSELGLLVRWVRAAPLNDILQWTPPRDRTALEQLTASPDESDERTAWAWLIDRCTETYLSSWRFSSLREEWRYLHGQREAPCAPKDAACRKVDEVELARLLADRAASAKEPSTRHIASPAPHYVELALKLLADGRRTTAAAIFEAASTLAPHDAELVNNWAFCLIPDDPARALELLDRAANLGFASALTLAGNRLYCLMKLGRYSTGLAYAEDVVSRWPLLVGTDGYMWSLDGSDKTPSVNLRTYALDLISKIASMTGDPLVEGNWVKTVEELRPPGRPTT
jgi:hypothetical protein